MDGIHCPRLFGHPVGDLFQPVAAGIQHHDFDILGQAGGQGLPVGDAGVDEGDLAPVTRRGGGRRHIRSVIAALGSGFHQGGTVMGIGLMAGIGRTAVAGGIGVQFLRGILGRLILQRLCRGGDTGGIEHHPWFKRLGQRPPPARAARPGDVTAGMISPTTKAAHDTRPPKPRDDRAT